MIKAEMDVQISRLQEEDRFDEAKVVHRLFVWFSIVYLGFGIADYLLYADRFWEFFAMRLGYCAVPIGFFFLAPRMKTFRQTEVLASIHAAVASGIITYMILTTEGVTSAYYAGLNLVGIIALTFFTFSRQMFWVTCGLIYLPYFVGIGLLEQLDVSIVSFILHTLFIGGTIVVSALIHHFKERYRLKNVLSQVRLREEIENRDDVIKTQTEEAIRMNSLSAQFSPQVVDSIRSGKIRLEAGGNRAQICAIFVDIVNSTERVTRIDKDKVERVLSRFLDDSIKIFLKYDITIDKFLGDGILGFCNAPLARRDYISRVVNAALELKEKVISDSDFYERNWLRPLEIRVGVAKGFATVGFFGSKRLYRSYTAIGPVVNLASRLCSSANANQILVDFDVFEEIQNEFESSFVGKKTLKGFEQDVIHTYEILANRKFDHASAGVSECKVCGSILSLETNPSGQYVFVCRSCDTNVDELPKKNQAA